VSGPTQASRCGERAAPASPSPRWRCGRASAGRRTIAPRVAGRARSSTGCAASHARRCSRSAGRKPARALRGRSGRYRNPPGVERLAQPVHRGDELVAIDVLRPAREAARGPHILPAQLRSPLGPYVHLQRLPPARRSDSRRRQPLPTLLVVRAAIDAPAASARPPGRQREAGDRSPRTRAWPWPGYLAEDPALGADVFVLVHALATKADAPEAMIAREVGSSTTRPSGLKGGRPQRPLFQRPRLERRRARDEKSHDTWRQIQRLLDEVG
jgi:hypothetical protein